MNEITKRKVLRTICHASALTSWSIVVIGAPIAVLLISDDPLVRDSAKEAFNFCITMALALWISIALLFTVVGIPLGILGLIVLSPISVIMPIVAIVCVCTDPDRQFHYPMTIRFFNTTDKTLQLEKA